MAHDTAMSAKRHIEMPTNNPRARPGQLMPAEGEDGLFTQSWFPVCMSSELEPGQLRAEPFLDGKVVVYRGEDGIARVMSAYCPHLGADLSIGCVVENRLQCAFHKWEYDTNGQCAKTGIGDRPPHTAQLYKFPSQERYGLVWAFNGDEPLWDLPDFEYDDDEVVFRNFRLPALFNCDPWVFAANTPDMQHLKAVHDIKFNVDDPHESVEWNDWGFRYKIIAAHQQGVPIEWTLGIRGTSIFWQEGPYDDFWIGGLVGFGLPQPGKHEVFAAVGLLKGDGSPEANALYEERCKVTDMLLARTVGEDTDILNTIHYRQGTLTAGDKTLSRYLTMLRNYPRAHPSDPFIR